MHDNKHHLPHTCVIYDPPAPNVPWLLAFFGPDRELLSAEAFETVSAALNRLSNSVNVFIEAAPRGPGQRVWRVKLAD
ncbi:hypothetical protein MOX02_28510 [Methylobacterium oxalidis]|uniref:Uncharacterized protein n=1 Tax=Methylobacterium oxalidis TaxID=944322 RepID=A0A512J4F3_9HYPH|nr:hypothetical protein MOX02_28510 [Methylobacterium oxalidis]GLS63639.1 hypothetical protein GCM10007888_20200 [Methylobacterium oxalidis]